jgi:Plant transposon protein
LHQSFLRYYRCIDCCKQVWKNCPKVLKGQYYNPKDSKLAVISVEAWCDRDLYVWHWFAGRCGTNNDLTVAGASPLFNDLRGEKWCPDFKYSICGEKRYIPYWLGDGIYPRWGIFAKPVKAPSSSMERHYTIRQEAVRKDIERCFGVLQARFNVLRVERKQWNKEDAIKEGMACVILHNMIVEFVRERDLGECDELGVRMTANELLHERYDEEYSQESTPNLNSISLIIENSVSFEESRYCSSVDHSTLQNILMTHLWELKAHTTSEI